MIHDWIIYDEQHQACRRCGLRLWRRGAGSWNAVTANGVPAPFGLLPDGSRLECVRPSNLLPELVVIDYTGDPDVHSGCERFMHRIRDGADPASSSAALALPGAAPTACGYPAVAWELGPARVHVGWTWCLDCFPERAGEGLARSRLALPAHAERWLAQQQATKAKAERKTKRLVAARDAVPKAPGALRYCYCPKCAGGWPSRDETIREVRSIRRKPQGWNPR
jgi:hypothetical protein